MVARQLSRRCNFPSAFTFDKRWRHRYLGIYETPAWYADLNVAAQRSQPHPFKIRVVPSPSWAILYQSWRRGVTEHDISGENRISARR